MSTEREKKLLNAAEAVRNAIRALDMDFPISEAENPMTPPLRRELINVRQRDVASLKLAQAIVESMWLDADGFAVLIELCKKKRWAFDSCVILAKAELTRIDAPVLLNAEDMAEAA